MPAIVGSSKLWCAYDRMHTPPASISKRRPLVRGRPSQRVMKQLRVMMTGERSATQCLPVKSLALSPASPHRL